MSDTSGCQTPVPKCSQPASSYGSPFEQQLDALARLDPADRREPARLRHGREQLEVLAEAEVVDGRTVCERNALELDDAAHTGAARDVAEVDREPVRDVHLGMRAARELASLVDPQRWPDVAAVSERGAGTAERAGDDKRVAGLRARAAGHALAAARAR